MNKQLNNAVFLNNWKTIKRLSLFLAISLITLFSCQEEGAIEIDGKTLTVTESEISPEALGILDRETAGLTADGVILGGVNPIQQGCNASVRFLDYSGNPVISNITFYSNTTLIETTRANGSCNFPVSLNQPCLFIGTLTINNVPGMTGNYRILTPSGAQINIGNLSGSFTYAYGRPQLPLGVFCGLLDRYIIQAEDPNAPGNWTTVYVIGFICSNCNLTPIDPTPVGQ